MTSSHSFTATLETGTNNFVAAIYDSTDVNTVLQAILVPKSGGVYPPSFQVTFTYNLIQDKVYRVILWESPDTDPHGISRTSGDFKASINVINWRGSLKLTADVSSGLVSGTSGYVDPTSSLAGWEYDLEQVGYGTLYEGDDYSLTPVTNDWSLLNDVKVSNLQKFVIHFAPQISAAPQPPISAISSGRIITANTTLTSADKNKALYIQATDSKITINMASLSSVADYDHFVFYSRGGNHINATIQFPGTDKVLLDGLQTQIILGQAEKLDIFKANGQWEVDYISPSYFLVGQYIYRPTQGEVNTLFGNGTLKLRADYPRLTKYVLTKLAATSKVAEASWASVSVVDSVTFFPNKEFWTEGTDGTNIRIPLLYNSGFLRGVDGVTRFPGSQQKDATPDHSHPTLTGSFAGALPHNPNGETAPQYGGGYNDTHFQAVDLTAGMYNRPGAGNVGTPIARIANETRPVNGGIYISICI